MSNKSTFHNDPNKILLDKFLFGSGNKLTFNENPSSTKLTFGEDSNKNPNKFNQTKFIYESFIKKQFDAPIMHAYVDKLHAQFMSPEKHRLLVNDMRRYEVLNGPLEPEYVFKETEFEILPIDKLREIIKTNKENVKKCKRDMKQWDEEESTLINVVHDANNKIEIIKLSIRTNLDIMKNGKCDEKKLNTIKTIIKGSREALERISSMVNKWQDDRDILTDKIIKTDDEIKVSKLTISGCKNIIEKIRHKYV